MQVFLTIVSLFLLSIAAIQNNVHVSANQIITTTTASTTRTRPLSSRTMNGANNEILSFIPNCDMKKKINAQSSPFGTRIIRELSQLEESNTRTRSRSVSSSKHYNEDVRRNAITNQESCTNNYGAVASFNEHKRMISNSCFRLVKSTIHDSLNKMKERIIAIFVISNEASRRRASFSHQTDRDNISTKVLMHFVNI